jgi:outer membrane protein TolC
MMKAAAALALALWAGAAFAQSARETLTLDEAVALAVKNSPAALAAEQDIIVARQRVREARFLYMPQIALSGSLNKVNLESPAVLGGELGDRLIFPSASDSFYSLRAQALQPLYTGGKNTNTLKLAKTAHSQARVNYDAVRADAALAAKKAFYTLLYQRRLNAAAAGWEARAKELAAQLRKDDLEALEAGLLLARLSSRARLAERGEDSARTELLRLLNKEPGWQADFKGDFAALPVNTGVGASLVAAMETRSDLKSELYKAQMDDIAVNMALVRRYPTIYLGAIYDVNAYKFSSLAEENERASNWLASVSIHFPLSYDIWTQVQQRKAQRRQGELKRSELQDKIRFEIVSSHKEALFQQQEAERLASELEQARAAYDRAARAARPSMSSLRALCAICDLEARQLEAVYGQLLARIRLEWAQGRDL